MRVPVFLAATVLLWLFFCTVLWCTYCKNQAQHATPKVMLTMWIIGMAFPDSQRVVVRVWLTMCDSVLMEQAAPSLFWDRWKTITNSEVNKAHLIVRVHLLNTCKHSPICSKKSLWWDKEQNKDLRKPGLPCCVTIETRLSFILREVILLWKPRYKTLRATSQS